MTPCLVCRNPHAEHKPSFSGIIEHECPRCGSYILMGTATNHLLHAVEVGEYRSVLSHVIRRAQGAKTPLQLYEDDLQRVHQQTLPKPQEQYDNLILWIGDHQLDPSQCAVTQIPEIAAYIGSPVTPGQEQEPAFTWLWSQIFPARLIDRETITTGELAVRLTMEGWVRYYELTTRVTDSRVAFMAMRFGLPERDRVFRDCFAPAAHAAGFELRTLLEKQPAGLIDNQIRASIRRAAFVVADLTDDNNGAYFEAGFAEGLGLDVIYTCETNKFNEKRTHFDTNHMVTVRWSADNLDVARGELTATIRNTLPTKAKLSDE